MKEWEEDRRREELKEWEKGMKEWEEEGGKKEKGMALEDETASSSS